MKSRFNFASKHCDTMSAERSDCSKYHQLNEDMATLRANVLTIGQVQSCCYLVWQTVSSLSPADNNFRMEMRYSKRCLSLAQTRPYHN